MLRQIETNREEIRVLTEEGQRKDRIIKQGGSKISSLGEEIQTKHKQNITDMNQMKLSHSSEVEQLKLQVRDLNTQSELMKAKYEAIVTELKVKAGALEIQIENNVQFLLQEREKSARRLIEEQEQHEIQIAKEREAHRKLVADYQDLRSEVIALHDANSQLQYDIIEKSTTIQLEEASGKRKDSELEANSRALQEKDDIISAMSEQLKKARQYLTAKQQVST